MYPKIKILLWERWRRTYPGLALIFILLTFGLLATLFKNQPAETALTQSAASLYFACTFFLIFLLNQIEGMNIDLAFPKRLFNYPVSTWILASIYLLYGIIIISIPFFIVVLFQKLIYGSTSIGSGTLLKIETVYIGLQALCWTGGPARYLYVSFSIAAIYGIIKIAGSLELVISKNILYTLVILFSLITSYWSVSEYRKGNWLNIWQWTAFFSGLFRRRALKHFSSPVQAQIWFELRQTGHLFPVAALSFVLVILAMYIYGAILAYKYDNQLVPLSGSISNIFIFVIAAAFIAGLLSIGVYYRDHASGASGFWLRRPMATWTFAAARLQAAVLSIVRVFIMLTVIVLLATAYDWAIGKLDLRISTPIKWAMLEDSHFKEIAMTIFGMLGCFLFYWVSLRTTALFFVLGYLFAFTYIAFGGDARFFLIINLFTIAFPIFVIAGFYEAMRRKVITKTTLIIAACVFPLIFLSLIPYPWFYSFDTAATGTIDLDIITAVRLISLSTLPLITLFSTPLIIDKLRHR